MEVTSAVAKSVELQEMDLLFQTLLCLCDDQKAGRKDLRNEIVSTNPSETSYSLSSPCSSGMHFPVNTFREKSEPRCLKPNAQLPSLPAHMPIC